MNEEKIMSSMPGAHFRPSRHPPCYLEGASSLVAFIMDRILPGNL